MKINDYERLQKMKSMTLRCRTGLGKDFPVVMNILDKKIKDNKYPREGQRRVRGQLEIVKQLNI